LPLSHPSRLKPVVLDTARPCLRCEHGHAHLAEFEQLVLLAILRLQKDAFAPAIIEEIEARTERFSRSHHRSRIAESLMLSLAGGVLGLLVAVVLLRVGSALEPTLDFATAFAPVLDLRAGLFTLIAATLAGVLAGVLPALREGRRNPATTLRAASGGAARGSRLRDALVIAQVAVSLVVLVAAGLFVQSLEQQRRLDPGFPLANGLMLTVNPSLQGYSPARVRDFYDRLLDEVGALPGVRAVTRSTQVPLESSWQLARIAAQGRSASPQEDMTALYYGVEPHGRWPAHGRQQPAPADSQ
jgi:hypothetical protein